MSAEALAFVFKHSPYRGVQRCIHLAIADAVGHDGVLFMRQERIAAQAMCSRETVNRTLADMVAHGYLIPQESRRWKLRVFRFVFLGGSDVTNGHIIGGDDVTNGHNCCDDSSQPKGTRTELSLKGDASLTDASPESAPQPTKMSTQQLVAYYVDYYRDTHNGHTPPEVWRKLAGRHLKQLASEPDDVLQAVLRACVNENKSPAVMTHLVADYHREVPNG